MLLYIFHYENNGYYIKKKIVCYQRNINKPLFKTFQHRAKISLSMKGNIKSDLHKKKIIIAHANKGVMTLLTKKKISIANKGKKKSNDFKKKISLALTGRQLSSEHKSKLTYKLSGNKNPRFGKKHSKTWKRKISMSIINKNSKI